MKDRVVQYPHRYQLVPVSGQSDTYDIIAKPGTVTEVGTPLNKATLLKDETALLYELTGPNAIPDKVFATIFQDMPKVGDVHSTLRDMGNDWLLCDGGMLPSGYPLIENMLSITDGSFISAVSPAGAGQTITGIDYVEEENVFVACTSANGEIIISSDASTWTSKSSGLTTNEYLNAVAHGDGVIICAGRFGNITISSDGGETWTAKKNALPNDIYAICYGANAFWAGTNAQKIYKSTDKGQTWIEVYTFSDIGAIRVIKYLNGIFFVAGSTLYTSTDGSNWTSRDPKTTKVIQDIAFGGGVYVLVGNDGAVSSSLDGLAWTARTPFTVISWMSVCYGLDHFLAVGNSGNMMRSIDGSSWTSAGVSTFGTSHIVSSVHGSGRFVIGGASNKLARKTYGYVLPNIALGLDIKTYIKGR